MRHEPDVLQMLADDKAAASKRTEQNRKDFPWTTSIIDLYRQDFKDDLPPFNPRVIRCCENGKTLGRAET